MKFSTKLFLSLIPAVLLACTGSKEAEKDIIRTLDDLNGKSVITLTGSVQEMLTSRRIPGCQVLRYDILSDSFLALTQGKGDATIVSSLSLFEILPTQPDLVCVCDTIEPSPIGFAFRKGQDKTVADFNKFLKEYMATDEFKTMKDEWSVIGSERPMPVFNPAECPNGALNIAVSAITVPFGYIRNGEPVGIEFEILSRFALSIGKYPVYKDMNFNAIIPYLSSGKADVAASIICITEERQASVDFSDAWTAECSALVVRKENAPAELVKEEESSNKTFIDVIASSFYNNFIKESRYKLIFDGLWMTIVISLLSALFGTLLGVLLSLCYLSRLKFISKTANLYIEFMRCMPQVVFLMIMFYVVFGNVKIDGSIVAIVAFSLCFAAYTSVIFSTTVKGIDKGQTEAALSMGFGKFKAFWFFILPQVVQRALPVYKGEFIGLIKATSIVGYIAVFDLTKAGDIVRSRTYDAFLPLITITAIYFLIIWVLSLLIKLAEAKTVPTRNKYHKA